MAIAPATGATRVLQALSRDQLLSVRRVPLLALSSSAEAGTQRPLPDKPDSGTRIGGWWPC